MLDRFKNTNLFAPSNIQPDPQMILTPKTLSYTLEFQRSTYPEIVERACIIPRPFVNTWPV